MSISNMLSFRHDRPWFNWFLPKSISKPAALGTKGRRQSLQNVRGFGRYSKTNDTVPAQNNPTTREFMVEFTLKNAHFAKTAPFVS
ncbi:MAG: hypothetical protein ACOCUY_02455, partial [Verrucomicrobiota bacterium]